MSGVRRGAARGDADGRLPVLPPLRGLRDDDPAEAGRLLRLLLVQPRRLTREAGRPWVGLAAGAGRGQDAHRRALGRAVPRALLDDPAHARLGRGRARRLGPHRDQLAPEDLECAQLGVHGGDLAVEQLDDVLARTTPGVPQRKDLPISSRLSPIAFALPMKCSRSRSAGPYRR